MIAALTMALALGMWLWRYFYRESAEDSTARRVAKNSIAPMALNLMNRSIDSSSPPSCCACGSTMPAKYYFAGVVITWFEIWMNFGLNTYLTREVSKITRTPTATCQHNDLAFLLGGSSFPVLASSCFYWRASPTSGDTALAITLRYRSYSFFNLNRTHRALLRLRKAEYRRDHHSHHITQSDLRRVGVVARLRAHRLVRRHHRRQHDHHAHFGILVARSFFTPRVEFDRALQPTMIRESFPLMINHLLATLFFKVDVTLLQPIRGGSKWVGIARHINLSKRSTSFRRSSPLRFFL